MTQGYVIRQLVAISSCPPSVYRSRIRAPPLSYPGQQIHQNFTPVKRNLHLNSLFSISPAALPEGFLYVGLRGLAPIPVPQSYRQLLLRPCRTALKRFAMTHLYSDHRRILLIDHNATKQNLRATILRNYEIEVHTASSLADAASLWKTNSYDLVLLAAQEKSEEATALSTQMRAVNPRQRIGLLVGPPAFVRELGRKRKKAESINPASPSPDADNLREPASSPQWQEMVRRLVSDWYVGQNAPVGLSRLTDRTAGA
jgi:CheY-like chemotaxis protein